MTARRLSLALFAALLGAACHKAAPEDVATTAAVPVQVAVAHVGTITSYVRVTGTIDPAPGADWTVTAPEKSRVTEIRYATGDAVRQGAVVVRFDAPPLRSDLATRSGEASSAHARLDNAKRNFDRLSILLEKGIASRKEVEDARKELLDAEAAVRSSTQTHAAATDLFARTTPIAPFSGVVAERWHNPGDVIDANEHVLRVVDLRRLQVTAAVPVADAARVVLGHAARVTVPGGEGTEIAGKVVGAPATVDTATGTAPIRVSLSAAVPVGTPVQLAIVAEQREGALIVPAAAIVRNDNKAAVFVVGADNKAHRRDVVVGLVSDDDAQIVSGVRDGEKVVVKGQDELPDGATVTVEESGEAEGGGKEKTTGEEAAPGGEAPARPGTKGQGAAPPGGTKPSPEPRP
jgi:RND family efflux transporter MFP subunit